MKALGLMIAALMAVGCHMDFDGQTIEGSGKATSEQRKLSGFKSVLVELAGDVNIQVGPEFSVKVTTDDNLHEHIKTSVKDGRLVIDSDHRLKHKKLVVDITMPAIEGFEIDGAGDATIAGIASNDFSASIEGAGDLKLSGKADRLKLSIEGAGNIEATDLQAKTASASIEGAGNIQVNASEELTASIEGAGSIEYAGDPKLDKRIDGVGSIRKR